MVEAPEYFLIKVMISQLLFEVRQIQKLSFVDEIVTNRLQKAA
jgi:hypothetical protein